MAELLPLDSLEVHTGSLVGPRRTPAPRLEDRPAHPRQVLDELLLGALGRPPCHVAFSGGRDSSIVLAAALRAARREGLADPVPLTARYPGHPATGETEWQEAVLAHLGIRDWVRFDVTTELEALGDIAVALLGRHGVYVPTPAHTMVLTARHAGGGSLITGTGGDEVMSDWGYRRRAPRELLAAPLRRAPLRIGLEALPLRVRRRFREQWPVDVPGWLRPPAAEWLTRNVELEPSERTSTWRRGLRAMVEGRVYEVVRHTLATFAADEGVDLLEPFYEPRFLAALARHCPRMGFRTRTEAVRTLFGDLLSDQVAERPSKAVFNSVLVGPRSHAFAQDWDGSGVDRELVEVDVLRREWSKAAPDVRSLPLLQLAWMATRKD